MKTDGNSPASPVYSHEDHWGKIVQETYGLTKREYFAAMAMQGLSMNERIDATEGWNKGRKKLLSSYAVGIADALIAELNKEKRDE